MSLYKSWCLEQQFCINNMLPSSAHTKHDLPFKWTAMSSNKRKPSRQQGLVTPPRPLVQSARLSPARLGTAEWWMEGRRSAGSGEEVSMNQWRARKMSGWKVKLGDGEALLETKKKKTKEGWSLEAEEGGKRRDYRARGSGCWDDLRPFEKEADRGVR